MTDTNTLAPTDAEILDAAEDFRSQYTHGGTTFDEFDEIGFARAVLAKWGAPAPASQPVAVPAGVEAVGEMRASESLGVAPYADIWGWLQPGTKLYSATQVQAMLSHGIAPGWQAVPVEPTSEMVIEAYEAQGEATSSACEEIYRAMLAAAPQPDAQPLLGAPAQPVAPSPECATFEMWWADHMPKSGREEAWVAWCALWPSQPAAQQGGAA